MTKFRVLRDRSRSPRSKRGDSVFSASRRFLKPFRTALARRVPVLLVFGTDDGVYAEFLRAMDGAVGTVLGGADNVSTVTIPGEVHRFNRIEAQDGVADTIVAWLSETILRDVTMDDQGAALPAI
jgi:pimeloyl-ACP methyl ester carboxylesterase